MKFPIYLCYLSVSLVFLGGICEGVAQEAADPVEGKAFREGKPKGPGGANEKGAWDSLEDGQKQQLREALREVWTDPAVLNAREEVKVATDAYQRAIRNAIGKADPSVAGVLKKLQDTSEGRSQERLGGGPPVRMLPRRNGDYPMGPPSFLENLSDEDRKKFREAEKAARESDAVSKAQEQLEQLRKEDEMLRRKRMEAFRAIRVATLDEMVRIDPSLAGLKEELIQSWRIEGAKRQKGGPKSPPQGGKPKPSE